MRRALAPAATLLLAATAAPALAQGVPAYEPPPPVTVQRGGQVMPREARPDSWGKGDESAALTANFGAAYAKQGKPRLALYWNRQLSETLSEWYSESRIVNRQESNSSMSGELTLTQTGSTQDTMEVQQRVRDRRRVQPSESFEWEFQDGFLEPFLEAGVAVIDRAAMMRLTGADMEGSGERTVEMRALQGKADYLMEILVGANARSTTGYELRARILDVTTGRIVAYVNSKGLKNWNPAKAVLATDQGFIDPDDLDEDDEYFGPVGDEQYRATDKGFERRRKPPKLDRIARNLALNTMNGLMKQWQ